jgi:hypothetical protein
MVNHPQAPQDPAEAARALSTGAGLPSRQCPAPGCDRPLVGRQRACSARCRAALSRRGQAERRQLRDRDVLALLEHAERLEARAAELRAQARRRLMEARQ